MVTLLFFVAQKSNAQINKDDKELNIRIGAKVGLNYSNVFDQKGDDFLADSKFGLAGGGFISIPLGLRFGLQPEVLFSQKGYKATGSIIGFDYEMTRKTSFIDIPLYFAFRPIPVITVLAGPQFSYLINQKDVFTSSAVSYNAEQEFKNENIRKNIMSLIGGIDINLNTIMIGARAGFDVQENQGDGTNMIPRYKNVWFQGTIGIRL
jgi:hypothetical protein